MQKIRLNKILAFVLGLSLVLLLIPGYTSGESYLLKDSYLYDKDGWKFIHIEGSPTQRGFQLGYRLADGIDSYRTYLAHRYAEEGETPKECWTRLKNESFESYWSKTPHEFKNEMRGIAKGVRAKGTEVDYRDILLLNSHRDLNCKKNFEELEERCSAFIANGSYTKDGNIVIAHSTWTRYSEAKHVYYFIHVKPNKGHEFIIQTGPGMVWGTTGWAFNKAGIVIAETALGFDGPGVAPYDDSGRPMFVRAREAVQYSDNIDECVETVRKDTNGAVPQDWLMGDLNTGEIAILEVGLYNSCLRSSRNGFFGSCNFIWDKGVASEWLDVDLETETASSYRFQRWEQLSQVYRGDIDMELAKEFLSEHYDTKGGVEDITAGRRILCAHYDLRKEDPEPKGTIDAKVMDEESALKMSFLAIRGHPCGIDFDSEAFLKEHPEFEDEYGLQDMPSYSWTTIAPGE
jgi:hypothetical protein